MPTLYWIGKEAVIKHHHQVRFHLLKNVPPISPADAFWVTASSARLPEALCAMT
jgi:hypothetical protein